MCRLRQQADVVVAENQRLAREFKCNIETQLGDVNPADVSDATDDQIISNLQQQLNMAVQVALRSIFFYIQYLGNTFFNCFGQNMVVYETKSAFYERALIFGRRKTQH